MKQDLEHDHDNPLHAALRGWVVDSPLPPHFEDRVWQRIAMAEVRPGSGIWASLVRLIEVVLPRPGIALSYVVTLLVLGVAAGSVTAQIRSSHLNADLSSRYVHLLDPYLAEASQP